MTTIKSLIDDASTPDQHNWHGDNKSTFCMHADALNGTQTSTTGDTYGLMGGTTHTILLEYYMGASSNASLDLKVLHNPS